jgi:uncharacterized protein (TIGR00255 family)
MIRSMTGYGQASAELSEARVSVELRTLNHRYADVRLRMPQELASVEREIRRAVLARIKRGRVELTINVESAGGGPPRPQLNRALLDEILASAESLRARDGVQGEVELSTLLTAPGLFRTGPIELEWGDDEHAAVRSALDAALEALDQERRREGGHLQTEMSERLAGMAALAADLRSIAATVPDTLRDRLQERLKNLGGSVELDAARVAQEAVLLAERADVTEELVRLEGHLVQARKLVDEPDGQPLGKRMDFLLQEINRETNTINSKSPELELSRKALAMKAEIEKVREQVQNVE